MMSSRNEEIQADVAKLLSEKEIVGFLAFAREKNGNVLMLRNIPRSESLGEWYSILHCEAAHMLQFLQAPPPPSPIATQKPGLILV